MYVITSLNERKDFPVLNLKEVITEKKQFQDWKLSYQKNKLDVLLTDTTKLSYSVTIRGVYYDNMCPNLTDVYIGENRVPLVSVFNWAKKGNKNVADITFILSQSDVKVIDGSTWAFSLKLPSGFESMTFISSKTEVRYVCALLEEPSLVAVEVSSFSFRLLWPTSTETCTVVINNESMEISGSQLKVRSVPDTNYTCVITCGQNIYNISVKTPVETKESYDSHYNSCRKNLDNSIVYDLSETSPDVIRKMREYGTIKPGDNVVVKDSTENKVVLLKALGNHNTFSEKGSFYIIPSFETEDEQWVCMNMNDESHVITFDRTESFVGYKGSKYNHGDTFNVGSRAIKVVKGSIILVVFDDVPAVFPGGTTTAAQILTAGDVVIRDLIMRSSYQITEKVVGDSTYATSSYYVYNATANTALEATRIGHGLDDTETIGSLTVDVLYTESGGNQLLHRALAIAPSETIIQMIDNSSSLTATFGVDGLKFNSNSGDVYFGENQTFRIHYEPISGNDPAMLQFQGYDSTTSSYVTRQLITNEDV